MKFFIKANLWLTLICLLFVSVAHAQENSRRLRVVNAALGLPEADVYVGNTLYFQSVYYSDITKYAPISAGQSTLNVRPAGVKDVDPVRRRENFDFNRADRDYTMFILGTAENLEDPWIVEDDNQTPLTPGKARVQFVHVSRMTAAVEMCLDNKCQTLAFKQRSDVGNYPDSEERNHYLTLDAGTYNLKVRLIGTNDLQLYKFPVMFDSGHVYTIFIFDPKQGETKPRIVPHNDTGQALPHYPDKGHPPYPPGPPGHPPLYPPVTGSFLSPTVLALVTATSLLVVSGLFWTVQRSFTRRKTHS